MFTFLNIDALLESLRNARQQGGEQSTAADHNTSFPAGLCIPSTVIFRDGELIDWYTGGFASQIKRKRKDGIRNYQTIIEAFSKKSQSFAAIYGMKAEDRIVAVLVCCKPGRSYDTECIQCQMLTEKKLESVIQGSRANRLTGYIVQHTARQDQQETAFQCVWTAQSFHVERVHVSKLESFEVEYRPARVQAMKKIMASMRVRYLSSDLQITYEGEPSSPESHSEPASPSKLPTIHKTASSERRVYNPKVSVGFSTKKPKMQRDESSIISVHVREGAKMSCAKIVSVFQEYVGSSNCARQKARDTSMLFEGRNVELPFEAVQMVSAFFCLSHDDIPMLFYCGVLMSHSDLGPLPINESSKLELETPSEETFFHFCAHDAFQLSSIGSRAKIMNLNEFLRLLRSFDILYKHVSVTDASKLFQKYSASMEEGGQAHLDFAAYQNAMLHLSEILKVGGRGSPVEALVDAGPSKGRAKSEALTSASSLAAATNAQFDLRQGYQAVKRFRDIERLKVARMFAQSIVDKQRADALEAHYRERLERHDLGLEKKRRALKLSLEAQREMAQRRLELAGQRVSERRRAELEAIEAKWTRVEDNVARFERERELRQKEREAEAEAHQQRRDQQLQAVRDAEEGRRADIEARARLIEETKARAADRKTRFRDMRRRFWDQLVLERFVVGEVFEDYIRTGSLHSHWAAADLDGGALEVAVTTVLQRAGGAVSAPPGGGTAGSPVVKVA